ncbi:hypothetical protein ACTQ4M_01130 [Lactobacillus amylovorus]|uniref:hypothetical protein n=1 Tax=Lactobacillus amylovorus TaxID=1604 RepID=UPI003F96195F
MADKLKVWLKHDPKASTNTDVLILSGIDAHDFKYILEDENNSGDCWYRFGNVVIRIDRVKKYEEA